MLVHPKNTYTKNCFNPISHQSLTTLQVNGKKTQLLLQLDIGESVNVMTKWTYNVMPCNTKTRHWDNLRLIFLKINMTLIIFYYKTVLTDIQSQLSWLQVGASCWKY